MMKQRSLCDLHQIGLLAVLGIGMSGCQCTNEGGSAPGPADESQAKPALPPAPPEAFPEKIDLPGAEIEMGTALGSRRWTVMVPGFGITKFPITSERYRQCIQAGVCEEPKLSIPKCQSTTEVELLKDPQAPVACARVEQAARYCEWLGARLPTAAEWSLATRGRSVRRFSWGTHPATCQQHWRGAPADPATNCDQELTKPLVGTHPAGAAASGIQDVLLVEAEYLSVDKTGGWPGCAKGNCLVAGIVPGAIDSFEGVGNPEGDDAVAVRRAAFRCAWKGG